MSGNSDQQHWIQGKIVWIGLILLSLAMEGVALFYQYVLNEPPCVLCIHFRILFVTVILFSITGLLARKYKIARILSALGILASFAYMLERAYQLLGTERGFVSGECGFALNYPDWIAIDKWIPSLFKPMTSCGYTPEILFGVSMAEALIVFSVIMTVFGLWFLVLAFRK